MSPAAGWSEAEAPCPLARRFEHNAPSTRLTVTVTMPTTGGQAERNDSNAQHASPFARHHDQKAHLARATCLELITTSASKTSKFVSGSNQPLVSLLRGALPVSGSSASLGA